MTITRQRRLLRPVGVAVAGLLIALLTAMPGPAAADDAEIEFWRSVKEATVPEELEAYLEAYPDGKFAPLARIRLKSLEAPDADDAGEEAAAPADADEGSPPDPDKAADDTPPEPKAQASSTGDKPEKKKIEITLGVNPSDATKGRLGVLILNSVPGISKALDLDVPGAAFVTAAMPGSPAEKAGIWAGHLIASVEGTPIPDGSTLVDVVGRYTPGAIIELEIIELAPTIEETKALLRRKADSEPAAAFALSNMLKDYPKISGDDPTARALSRKAAELGYLPAMFALGASYDDGVGGYTRDDEEAAEWYRKAADKGHARAAYRLGRMYGDGEGVAKDEGKAVHWYRKAADRGNLPAMFDLGVAYGNGKGVSKDSKKAMEWFRKGADLGSPDSMSNVGYMYEQGMGVSKDYGEAAEWYRKAVALGHPTAKNNLALLYAKGQGVPKDPDHAAELFLEAYLAGGTYAKQNLEEKSSAIESETRRALQRKLKEEGVYTGKIDGRFGSGTKRALIAYASKKRPTTPTASSQPPPADDFGLGDLGTLD